MKYLTTIFLLGLFVFTALAQSTKPKPTAAKPKPAATPIRKPEEKAEWEKAIAVADGTERVVALKKFVETFPKSTRNAEAVRMVVTIETQLGNDKLAAADVPAAVELFKAAANDAPKPIPDQLFTETLSKIPANLYFRNARDAAFEITKTIEDKSDTNVGQLLNIAGFYMSIENGSEAKRIADNAVKLDPNSSPAYQTLGLANRIEFQLDESAAAYTKALELDPESLAAKRGLAEMKRSLGRSDEAVSLYREILVKDEANLPAQTGLVLALFDADKRSDAEAELARSLDANPGNIILLAGAAYWYAAHDEGEKAVALAQKAVAADARFIWSHIALARGLLRQKDPAAAEKTLIGARRYGNFPTLEYEIASARLAAGYYREAAEELAKSFSVKDGVVQTKLGRRVQRESKYFTELIGFERRASIFEPTAADDPENSAKLAALLEFKQEIDSPEPKPETAAKLADEFVKGDDNMKVYRQIFAASELLEKKIALPKVIEFAKSATGNVEAGLDVKNASIAVMAGELYENRSIAAARNEYIIVPEIPRLTLSAILRGEIEELNGWATFQMDDPTEALIHLRRAVSVLPVDSAWWRSSTWRLASVLAGDGKDAEALDMYIKSYKSTGPNAIRYGIIEALYKKVNSNTDGLEAKIGPNPVPPVAIEPVAQKVEPTPEAKAEATPETKTEPTPTATPTRESSAKDAPKPDPTHTATPEETKPAAVPEARPEAQKTPDEKPKVEAETKPADTKKDLFPPVIITIPASKTAKTTSGDTVPKPEPSPTPAAKPSDETKPTPEIKPCKITVSEENISLQNGGGDLAVIVGLENDGDLEGITAVSSSPQDIDVRREVITGVRGRALFVIRSVSKQAGVYQIKFELPCGKKEIIVTVH